MVSTQVKRYLALVLLVVVVSTAWTITTYIWRDRTLRLLGMQGTDSLFAAARAQRILSISVTPERKLGNVEFRFRCLVERKLADVPINLEKVTDLDELFEACRPVADRLNYFSTMGADEYVQFHEVVPNNAEGLRLIFVDFGRIYASLFDPAYGNESVTTFAFLVNSSDHLVGYFEGYSEILVMRGTFGRILRRSDLLDMVRIESGPIVTEYVPDPGPGQLSLDELPPWGQVAFEDVPGNEPCTATIIVKEGMIGLERLLFAVETYADGNWFEDASGYWVIKTRRI